jgi:hypothetical protein
MAPAGQLWSTTGDLARFAVFLADGDDRVLSAESVREMRTPAAPAEAADVVDGSAYGLGLQVQHRDGRLLVGHSGSLPGFLASLTISLADDVSAVVLANCTSGPLVSSVAADLVRIVAEAEPRIPEPWRPMPEVDAAVLELAGQWYWGTHGFALRLTADGGASLEPLAGNGRRSRFRANGDGTWTGLEGYYAGELLRPVRRPDGSVSPPGPRIVRLHASAVRRERFCAGWGGPGGVAGDPLAAAGWGGVMFHVKHDASRCRQDASASRRREVSSEGSLKPTCEAVKPSRS